MSVPLQEWSEFDVAMVGATAALAGLVIVAASVNIAEIVKAKSLTARLASAIAGLLVALAGSALGLMPGMNATSYSVAMIAIVAVALVFAVQATLRIIANHAPENRMRVMKAGILFATPAAYLLGAILLLCGSAGGLTWFAIGSIVSVVVALIVSWVVLVEVLR